MMQRTTKLILLKDVAYPFNFERKWLLDLTQLSMQNLWFLQKFAPKNSCVICFISFLHMRLFTLHTYQRFKPLSIT